MAGLPAIPTRQFYPRAGRTHENDQEGGVHYTHTGILRAATAVLWISVLLRPPPLFYQPHPPALPQARHFLHPAPDCTYRGDPQSGHFSPVILTPSKAVGFSAISRVTSADSFSVRWAAGRMFR